MANIFNEDFRDFKGCDFDKAYKINKVYNESGLPIRFIHINTLIKAKTAAGRYKDLDDIEAHPVKSLFP